ncbi:iron-sulfur cluster biosynthesis family protein [Paenibacillus caui]|uniref:iron-sulfur cluster biosynthesis family protein n=1 Tax=Paenibacillus caui TaxID=2873927 RepID=UPI001CA7CEAB|nr:iron-sulfur cluster biosynthesis family protein [Paenibacillus caui]
MKITLDQAAAATLSRRLGDADGEVRLVFDMEGCGCGINGIPALQIVDRHCRDDVKIDSDAFSFWIHQGHAIFFEEELMLKGEPPLDSFRLSSPSQIYKSNIKLSDLRSLGR